MTQVILTDVVPGSRIEISADGNAIPCTMQGRLGNWYFTAPSGKHVTIRVLHPDYLPSQGSTTLFGAGFYHEIHQVPLVDANTILEDGVVVEFPTRKRAIQLE